MIRVASGEGDTAAAAAAAFPSCKTRPASPRAGLPLSVTQEKVRRIGWAIESRVYAEDPLRGFLPSIGNTLYYHTAIIPLHYFYTAILHTSIRLYYFYFTSIFYTLILLSSYTTILLYHYTTIPL